MLPDPQRQTQERGNAVPVQARQRREGVDKVRDAIRFGGGKAHFSRLGRGNRNFLRGIRG